MAFKCEFCGQEYEESPGKFCDRCGRAIERINIELDENSEPEYKSCNQCGHRNPIEARICENCGELIYHQIIS